MLQLEFGPGHQVWQYLERGVQIVIGVSAVSTITFLGEVWGADSVPYEAVFIALWWLGYGFMIALMPTPLCWALVPILGQPSDKEPKRKRILQGWAVFSLIAPLVPSPSRPVSQVNRFLLSSASTLSLKKRFEVIVKPS